MTDLPDGEFLKELFLQQENKHVSVGNIDFYTHDFHRQKAVDRLSENGEDFSPYDLASTVDSSVLFNINNRKYLGSKVGLLDFLEEKIVRIAGTGFKSFFDGFAGTGVVGNRFRRHAKKIIANDNLFSNYLTNQVFLCSTRDNVSIKKITRLIMHLNSIPSKPGYVTLHYGGTYFTGDNAAKIDAVREEIENLFRAHECSYSEKNVLLVSLLYAMDKIANTVGQYDAFLKHIGSPAYDDGRHKVDASVYSGLVLKRPLIYFGEGNVAFQKDINDLALEVEAEVVYLDPPYNHRQYIDCYHVLENVLVWQKPELFGKTKKFKRDGLKSPYSSKTGAYPALAELIDRLKCSHIFLSYNSEGIIPVQSIRDAFKKKGKVYLFQKDYPVFGHGAGVSRKRKVKENLFYCEVRR